MTEVSLIHTSEIRFCVWDLRTYKYHWIRLFGFTIVNRIWIKRDELLSPVSCQSELKSWWKFHCCLVLTNSIHVESSYYYIFSIRLIEIPNQVTQDSYFKSITRCRNVKMPLNIEITLQEFYNFWFWVHKDSICINELSISNLMVDSTCW